MNIKDNKLFHFYFLTHEDSLLIIHLKDSISHQKHRTLLKK